MKWWVSTELLIYSTAVSVSPCPIQMLCMYQLQLEDNTFYIWMKLILINFIWTISSPGLESHKLSLPVGEFLSSVTRCKCETIACLLPEIPTLIFPKSKLWSSICETPWRKAPSNLLAVVTPPSDFTSNNEQTSSSVGAPSQSIIKRKLYLLPIP